MLAQEAERKKLEVHNGSAPAVTSSGPITGDLGAVRGVPVAKSDDVLALAPPEKLAELVTLALARAHDILSIKLDPQHQDFIKLVSLQQSTLSSVLATQARTDPGRLRGQQGDKIGELLEKIRAGSV